MGMINLKHAHKSNILANYKNSKIRNFSVFKKNNQIKNKIDHLLFKKGIINLYGGVDDGIANSIIKNSLFLNCYSNYKEISLFINSPGGSVTSGLAMLDVLTYIRPKITTICIALAASMGAFLLSSGFKGQRYGFRNSRIMIHQP